MALNPLGRAIDSVGRSCRHNLLEIFSMRQLYTVRLLSLMLVGFMQNNSWVKADIIGFGNFSGFTINQADSASAPTIMPGAVQITSKVFAECRSIFANTPQDISTFSASFTYRAAEGTVGGGYGAAFVLQNSGAGAHTISSTIGSVPLFGYAPAFNQSAAISLEYLNGSVASGFYTNGLVGGGAPNTSPVNLFSGNPINVTLVYDGSILHETLVDAVTSASYDALYLMNLPAIVGGSSAYVGFTAGGSGGGGDSNQFLSNFQFVSNVPEPSTVLLLAIGAGGLALRRRRRRRTSRVSSWGAGDKARDGN